MSKSKTTKQKEPMSDEDEDLIDEEEEEEIKPKKTANPKKKTLKKKVESDEEISEGEENEGEEEEEGDLSVPEVAAYYKFAADVATKVLKHLLNEAIPGKRVVELCTLGDNLIQKELNAQFPKVEKGVAFPTSVSVNNQAGHFSPLAEDKTVLNEGDLAKIDLSVHVSGYVSSAAHTTVVRGPKTKTKLADGKLADVVCAAHFAAEAALRLIKPGNKNTQVSEAIQKVAEEFHVNPLEGVLSHQLTRYVIDGSNVIANKLNLDHKVEEFTFEENEVYAVDIVMSSGEGKAKELDTRTTIYKRATETSYLLKLKAARYVLNEVNKRFTTFPFTVRALDEKRAKFGIVECLNHGLVQAYPVLYEKPGEFIAQFKFTVFLFPEGTKKANILGLPFVSSQYSIKDAELLALINSAVPSKKKAKKNKNKKKKKKPASSANNNDQKKDEEMEGNGDKMDTTS